MRIFSEFLLDPPHYNRGICPHFAVGMQKRKNHPKNAVYYFQISRFVLERFKFLKYAN